MHRFILGFLVLFGSSFATESPMVRVEIVPLVSEVSPGVPFDVAVIFSMKPDWHIYWQNPGEAGLATSFDWTLPDGYRMISKHEPVPNRHVEDGITTFIHENEAIFLFQVLPPAQLLNTDSFQVDIRWLECNEVCRPGSRQFGFQIPLAHESTQNIETWRDLRLKAETHFPMETQAFEGQARPKRNRVELRIPAPMTAIGKLVEADFFPFEEMIYDIGSTVLVKSRFRRTSIVIPLAGDRDQDPKRLQGVLIQKYSSSEGLVTIQSIIDTSIH